MTSADDVGPQPEEKPEAGQQAKPAKPAEAAKPKEAKEAGPGRKGRRPEPDEAVTPEREKARSAEQLAGLSQQIAAGTNATYLNVNLISGPVNASNATFGSAGSQHEDATGVRTRTGRITDDEMTATCEHFAKPPKFREAAQALARDRIVVLSGPSGLGKRTAAIRLLLDVGAEALEVISPTLTLEELSKHELTPGHGYLVEDWQQALRTDGTGDYNWRVLRDYVSDSTAQLVITTVASKARQCVTHCPWAAPAAAEVLAVYLSDSNTGTADDLIRQITEKIPPGYPEAFGIGSVAVIGRKLAGSGNSPETLQQILHDLSSDPERYVSEWLSAEERTDEEIQRVTALCFAASHSERIYELMHMRLEATLRDRKLVKGKSDGGLGRARTRRSMGIIERKAGVVQFQGEAEWLQYQHHRHAVQELWRCYDMNFWLAVHEWLAELIEDTTLDDVHVSVAVGLKMLAFTALDEVEHSYLHLWATGERGWPGQRTAVYVLWLMSRDNDLSPVALRIATDWVNSGDSASQWTAAAALSGELGAAYPATAAARLWHLVGQGPDVPTKAVIALASLFATLAKKDDGEEAHQVLELLRDRLEGARVGRRSRPDLGGAAENPMLGTPPTGWQEHRKNEERALLSIVEVLSIRDPLTKQPSITSFLHARPEHLELVAELWAVVLENHMYRKRALTALLNVVRGFEYVSDDPEEAARSLGDALTKAVPEAAHRKLSMDFTNLVVRVTRPGMDTAAAVTALLNAFEHLLPERRAE